MRWIATILSFGALGALSTASTLFVDGLQSGKHEVVNIKYNGNGMKVRAGTFTGRLDSSAEFDMYCVDLDHSVSPPSSYEVNVQPVNMIANSSLVAQLYTMFNSDVNSKTKGAALQMAIWDAVVDGGDGLYAGSFKDNGTSSGIKSQFATYLSTALTASPSSLTTLRYFEALSHPHGRNQNMIGPVPEPGSMAALAVGAMGILRRRRAAKNA